MIVVTGATGTVGRRVVAELLAAGVAVRALSRRVAAGRCVGVEVVRFSLTEPATWPAAFAGAEAMFLMRPPQVTRVRRDLLPAVAAAGAAGVRRVVFLSVLGAQHNPLLPHRQIERWLDGSGMSVTHVRAGNFMQNLTAAHGRDLDAGRLVLPAGNAALSYVDACDVAAAAARSLLAPTNTTGAVNWEQDHRGLRGADTAEDGGGGSGYDITGPEAITHYRIASILTDVLQRPVRYEPVSLPRYWTHARDAGIPSPLIAVTSALYTLARIGVGARVTDDVAGLLHRPATDFATFAHRELGHPQ